VREHYRTVAAEGRPAIARIQQDMIVDRSHELWAAVDGTFVVKDKATDAVVDGNALPDGTRVAIEWTNTRPGGRRGADGDVLFLSPASLAMELHAMTMGTPGIDAEYKHLEGGLLYLTGEPHIFWSMMIHRRATGVFLPPQPAGQTLWTWSHTWPSMELARMTKPLTPASMAAVDTSRQKVHMQSRSLAALQFFQGQSPPAYAEHLMSALGEVEDAATLGMDDNGVMAAGALPDWWTRTELLWGGALARAVAATAPGGNGEGGGGGGGGGVAPCMFHCTPMGCVAVLDGGTCQGFHDVQYKRDIEAIKGPRRG